MDKVKKSAKQIIRTIALFLVAVLIVLFFTALIVSDDFRYYFIEFVKLAADIILNGIVVDSLTDVKNSLS